MLLVAARRLSTAIASAATSSSSAAVKRPTTTAAAIELQGTALSPALSVDQLETVVLSSPSKAFTATNCSQTIYLLGTKRSSNKFALDRVLALSKDMEFTPPMLSQIFTGLAGNRAIDRLPPFLVMHPTLTLGLSLFSPLDLSSVVYSLARLNQREPEVMQAIAKEIAGRQSLADFSGDDLSTILYSYCRLRSVGEEGEEEVAAMRRSLYQELVQRDTWDKFRSVDFADLMVAFASAAASPPPALLLEKWRSELVRSNLTRWRGSDFTKIISSLSKLSPGGGSSTASTAAAGPFLRDFLFDKMLGRGHFKFNGHDLEKITGALADLGVAPPRVFFDRLVLLVQQSPGALRTVQIKNVAANLKRMTTTTTGGEAEGGVRLAVEALECEVANRAAAAVTTPQLL